MTMFERFTKRAREVVTGAQTVARAQGAATIGSEHLLRALYDVPDNLGVMVLTAFSVGVEDVDEELDRLRGGGFSTPSDAAALASIGIDLDEVRRQIEETFGPGALDRTRAGSGLGGSGKHIPFSRDAKKVLEIALREAILLRHNYIGCEHLVLGMLHPDCGAAGEFLRTRGVSSEPARIIVQELVRGRRAS
jgi:ATP-dependent Clp protease ATP-binding subunit ClpA